MDGLFIFLVCRMRTVNLFIARASLAFAEQDEVLYLKRGQI